jgi:AcrR family transcriptional regulator
VGRPRGFDEDAALEAAMRCFREHGFVATSIRDLESATGLRAPSLYNTFGDKAQLFARALARYDAVVLQRRIGTHLRPEAGVDGIHSFFTSVYTEEPQPELGCLLATSAAERAELDRTARDLVEVGLGRIRAAFLAVLERGARRGQLRATDAARTADALVLLYQGLLVVLRAQSSAVDVDGAVDAAIDALTRPSRRRTKETRR